MACDGGLFRTDQAMGAQVTWRALNQGLITTQFFSIGLDQARPWDDFLIGGLQDNATRYTWFSDSKSAWRWVIGGDGLSCKVADGKEFIISSVYNGQFWTFTFDHNDDPTEPIFQLPSILDPGDFNFYTNFALDPVHNQRFYLPAKNRLWRKNDLAAAAKDETLVDDGWQEMTGCKLPQGESITRIAVSRYPAHRLYFGSDHGRVFRVDHAHAGNPIAMDVTGPAFARNGFVAWIEIVPNDADQIFAVFSNYNVPSIFHSIDGGASWSDISGNLEEYPDGSGAGPSVRCLTFLKRGSKTLYFAGTSVGLYVATRLEGPDTFWKMTGEDSIGRVTIEALEARHADGLVAAATQGSGVFSVNAFGVEGPDGSNCFVSTARF